MRWYILNSLEYTVAPGPCIKIASDNLTAHLGLVANYILMGREQEARAEAAEVLRINPKFSLDYYASRAAFKDQAARDKIAGALRKAGLK